MNIQTNQLYNSNVLDLLERLESGIASIVYLDPPWNSSGFLNDEAFYDFIVKVIEQSKRILKNSGLVVFHADAQTKISIYNILNDVFGNSTFENEFIIPIRNRKTYNSLILYHKNQRGHYDYYRPLNKKEVKQRFPYSDDNGKFNKSPLLIQNGKNFEWKGILPTEGKGWRCSKERLDILEKDNKIIYKTLPLLKTYFDPLKHQVEISTIWEDIEQPQMIKYDNYIVFSQTQELGNRIINIANSPNGLIIDPFMGSGSFILSAIHNDLEWIGADNAEIACQITKERLSEITPHTSFKIQNNLSDYPIICDTYQYISETKQIKALINKGETEFVEFKEAAFWNPYRNRIDNDMIIAIIKAIVAFLNSYEGGNLIIGINDKDGNIVGLEKDFESANPQKRNEDGYILKLSDKIQHAVGLEVMRNIEFKVHYIDEKPICLIKIKPSNIPVFHDTNFLFRKKRGKETIKKAQLFFDFYTKRWNNSNNENR